MEYLGFLIMHNYVSPPKNRSVHMLYHLLYAEYFLKQLVYICYLFLQDVDTFPPLNFVSTLYPVLSTSVSTLDQILYPPVSMLYQIYYWFDLTLTAFTTQCVSYGSYNHDDSQSHLQRCSACIPKRPTERFIQACLTANVTSSVSVTQQPISKNH